MIATHDEDFLNLLLSKGFPPKLILLRTGNLSSLAIAQIFQENWGEIQGFMDGDSLGVIEIFKTQRKK